jgi:hypothetical protein
MKIEKYEEMSWDEFLNGVIMGGVVFLKDVFRRCPQVVINYRIMLYEHAKSCKWDNVIDFLEGEFEEFRKKQLENRIEVE